ncbi:MAG: xanthine dehydrogenase accessory protein XdhC [Woeseia sp.]
MIDWLPELLKLQETGSDCVRVTVMDARGSAPREIGATMLVTANEVHGSIGGGQLEYECTRIAAKKRGRTDFQNSVRQMGPPQKGSNRFSKIGSTPFVRTFPLGAGMGQCCGGVVDVLFEYVPAQGADWLTRAQRCFASRTAVILATSITADGACLRALLSEEDLQHADDEVIETARRIFAGNAAAVCVKSAHARTLLEPIMDTTFAVALFGAGHVGSALVNVLANLDCQIRWIDGRRDMFPSFVPGNVTAVESADPAREVLAMPPGTAYLVMTHNHPLDYEICEQILARDDFAYCGLIGSRSKRRRFEKRLRGQGMLASQLERLTCPIGIAGVEGKKPGEIAVAVAAQLLTIRQSISMSFVEGDSDCNVHLLRR